MTVKAGLEAFLSGKGVEVAYAKGCEAVDANWPDSEIVPTPLEPGEIAAMDEAVRMAEGVKLKLQYFGHLMRRVDSLEKTLMLGGIRGRRRRR